MILLMLQRYTFSFIPPNINHIYYLQKQKNTHNIVSVFYCVSKELLLRHHLVAVHELINTTSGVDELSLTCVEWM